MWFIRLVLFLILGLFLIKDSLKAEEEGAFLKELAREELEFIRGASLWEERLSESPVPVMVYEREYFERFGFKNMRDFLDYLPSFYLTSGYGERSITFRGFRSITSASVLFLEDFQRLTSPDYESFPVDRAFPLKDISKVEMLYGAGGALYGGGSFSGVTLIERRPEKEGLSLEAERGEYSSERYLARLNYKGLYLLSQRGKQGEESLQGLKNYETNAYESLLGKYSWKKGSFSFIYMKEKTELDRNMSGKAIDPILRERFGDELKVSYLGMNLYQEFPINPFFKLVVIPSLTTFKAEIPFYTSISSFPFYFNQLSPRRLDLLTYLTGEGAFGKIVLGAEVQKREFRDYSTDFYFKVGPLLRKYAYTYPEDDDFMYSFFFGYKKEFEKVILNLGARYEHYEGYAGKVIPRVGLIYKLNPRLSLLLSYTEGFNIPSFYHKEERIISLGKISYAFNKLSPEREKTYQLSALYKKDETLKVRGTLFYQKQINRIWRDPKTEREVNLPSFNLGGLELELTGKMKGHLYFLNYSYLKVLEAKNQPFIYREDYITGFPRWMLKGGLSLKLPFSLSSYLSPSFKFIGPTRDKSGKIVSDYLIWDLNSSIKLSKGATLGIKVENLFDKHYERAGTLEAIPWEGRRTSLELRLDF